MTTHDEKLKASVVIPTKNGGSHLKSVIEAIFRQKTEWPFEILVIDSGSSDKTIELINSFAGARLIEIRPEEFGHGKTRNVAISQAKGEFIAMITQDALPENESWLSELVDTIETDPRIAGVFGRHIAYDDASPFTKMEIDHHFTSFLTQPIVYLDDNERYKTDETYRQLLYFFSDNNALLRRSVWEHIPYPDVDFAEDQAWAREIIEHGYLKAYAHNAIVRHSHNYGLIERLQRSFDESYALKRLFNYKGGKAFWFSVKSFIALTRRDFIWGCRGGLFKGKVSLLLRMPVDNFMRVIGHYLGARGETLPEYLRLKLSRDRKLMVAHRKAID